jgi:ribosomal protein S18 acetylase RimI-like enzyme
MSGSFRITRLQPSDAEAFRIIRLAALRTAREAFGSTYEIEANRPLSTFAERLSSSTVFGAYDGQQIVGMAGFMQEAGPKVSHKAFVWGFYVEPAWRARGAGSALVAALIEAARDVVEQLTLTVVEGNDAAIALYAKFGFTTYGVEPRALKTPSGYVNEILMGLHLPQRP